MTTTEGRKSARPRRGGGSAPEGSERRQSLLATAAGLFADNGFSATTVREIADAAGVLPGSLYHHFDSKEAIVDELLANYLDQLVATYRKIVAEPTPSDLTLSRLIIAAFESLVEHRAAVIVLQHEQLQLSRFPRFAYLAEREAEVERIWTGVIRQGVEEGVFRRYPEPGIVYRHARDCISAVARWYREDGELTIADVAKRYLTLLLHGLNT
ncbi:TetR/AcrR family transcriptional regulator [Dactylosporangium sp. NPDC005572]|uniref:TetR/AcrR family transcriptional regulator n=1 Tax=Dactylosporangium sp. NPDC005572 TaxID=3156889 RepID=UPI0033B803CF